MTGPSVRRLDFGYFVRPAEETVLAEAPGPPVGAKAGAGSPTVVPSLGYLIEHAGAVLLFDSGMGSEPEVDAHYRPARRPLTAALAAVGRRLDAIELVANCHLHFDHCGGNPQLTGRPIFTQRVELATARGTDYTLPELVDAGLRYEELDGEAEVLPDVHLIPTPGHTAGHQSLVVRRSDGTVVVAGQSHDTSSAYGADVLAWRAARSGHRADLPITPAWIERLQEFDPARVYFAHDRAVWEP
jgi:N-acyl homoserine lactone hydrolase